MKLNTAIAIALVAALPLTIDRAVAQTAAPKPASPPAPQTGSPPGTRLPAPLIGVVDLQAVVGKSAAWKGIREQLDKSAKAFQGDMKKRSDDLNASVQTLESQHATLSAEAYSERRMSLETQGHDFQNDLSNGQKQFDEVANEGQRQVAAALMDILEQIRQERGLNLILQRGAVPAMAPDFDLSEEALQRLDKKLPRANVKMPQLTSSAAPTQVIKH